MRLVSIVGDKTVLLVSAAVEDDLDEDDDDDDDEEDGGCGSNGRLSEEAVVVDVTIPCVKEAVVFDCFSSLLKARYVIPVIILEIIKN